MQKGKGTGKILWVLSIVLITGSIIIGCSGEGDPETGEGDESEEAVMKGEIERDDEKESEKESKDDEIGPEKTESEDATGNSGIVEVTSQELQKITVEPYEIGERLVLSGDGDYLLTEMPVAPGTVHIISEFETWKKAYDEMDSDGGPSQPMYWYGSLLKEAWSDPADYRGDRLENHPVDSELFISHIDFQEVSPDGKNLLYRARMYEEEGQYDGPESITGLFTTRFETPVAPMELKISGGYFFIEPFWSSDSDVIYYVLEDGLFTYTMDDGEEEMIIPSKDLPGIPSEEKEGRREDVLYDIYRDEESTFVYYFYDDKIMKISLKDEAAVEIFYDGDEARALKNITVLQENVLLLSPRSRLFGRTETLLSDGKETGIEKIHGNSQLQDHYISENGHIFLLFTTHDDEAEVQVFDEALDQKMVIRLPDSFSHYTVLGNAPCEANELAVIGDEYYYLLSWKK